MEAQWTALEIRLCEKEREYGGRCWGVKAWQTPAQSLEGWVRTLESPQATFDHPRASWVSPGWACLSVPSPPGVGEEEPVGNVASVQTQASTSEHSSWESSQRRLL